jgi:hypothetical protein
MLGNLARSDDYGTDPMTGLPIGAREAPPDPRESLPLWARQAEALPNPTQPLVGSWPAYTPPRELPDVGPPAIPSGPAWQGNPVANRAADAMGSLAMTSVLPQDPLDAGLMLATGPGRAGYKIAAGAMGALLNPDEAEAGVRGISHGISGITLRETPQELAKLNRHVPTKDIFEKAIEPHDIPVGSWLTPLVGDRSRSGELLTHVGEKELRDPVWMQGGYQFIPEWKGQNVAWGSDRSPTSTIAGRVREAQKEAPDVYGVYTAMSPKSVDASHHMSDTLSQMMHGQKVDAKAVEQFNEAMRNVMPEFPGVKSEKLQAFMRSQPMSNRDYFAKGMSSRSALEAGFPDVAQARIAVTHPELLDVPMYSGGQSIAKLTGDVTHGSPGFGLAPHYTYRSKLHGQYAGGFGEAVPQELLWRDFAPKVGARNPSAVGKIWLTGLQGEKMGQLVDPRWQDSIAEYLHKQRR